MQAYWHKKITIVNILTSSFQRYKCQIKNKQTKPKKLKKNKNKKFPQKDTKCYSMERKIIREIFPTQKIGCQFLLWDKMEVKENHHESDYTLIKGRQDQ